MDVVVPTSYGTDGGVFAWGMSWWWWVVLSWEVGGFCGGVGAWVRGCVGAWVRGVYICVGA